MVHTFQKSPWGLVSVFGIEVLLATNLLDDPAKFSVSEKPMFAYAFLFDSSKHSRPLRFGNVEPQLVGFQDNAVEPALLS